MNRSKLAALATSTVAVLALAMATAPPADAGWFRHCRARESRCRVATVTPGCRQAVPTSLPTSGPPRVDKSAPAAVQATYLLNRNVEQPRAVQVSPGGLASPASASGSFLAWINGVRARHGLRPVAWDASLVPFAAANSARGFGHWPGTNTGYQNVGAGGSLATIQAMWLASPGHAAAILAPGMTSVGLANVNGVYTMNGR